MSHQPDRQAATSLPRLGADLWGWPTRRGVVPLLALVTLAAGMVVGGGLGCNQGPGFNEQAEVPQAGTQLLTVQTHGSGSGRILSTPSGVDCFLNKSFAGTCSFSFPSNTSVELRVYGDPGMENTWNGFRLDGFEQPLITPATITMGQDHTVSIAFGPLQAAEPRLTIESHGPGRGRIWSSPPGVDCFVNKHGLNRPEGTCSALFPLDSSVELMVVGDPGEENTWIGFLLDGGAQPLISPATTTMNGAHTASFAFGPPLPTFQLKVEGSTMASAPGTVKSAPPGIDCHLYGSTVGGGTCAFAFPQGTAVTLTAEPDAGSTSPSWEVWSPGAPCAPGPTCVIAMEGTRTVAAGFDRVPTRAVNINASGWDNTVSPPVELAAGVAGTIVVASADAACDFTACAAPNAFYIPGAIPCHCYPAQASTVVLQAIANPGYRFSEWAGDCTSTAGAECTVAPGAAPAFVGPVFTKP